MFPENLNVSREEVEGNIMCFADRCDHAIPLFLLVKTLPIHFLYYKLLVKGFVHSYRKIHDLQFPTTFISKSKLEIRRKLFPRIGAKLWNEIPTKLRTLPKLIFERKIRMILFNILESEVSYEDLESIISKVRKYSQ